jgi:hypothetical protein
MPHKTKETQKTLSVDSEPGFCEPRRIPSLVSTSVGLETSHRYFPCRTSLRHPKLHVSGPRQWLGRSAKSHHFVDTSAHSL